MYKGRTGTFRGTGQTPQARPSGVVYPSKGSRVKVSSRVLSVPPLLGRALVVIPLAMAISFGAISAPAYAITRSAVIKRANHWIKQRVGYSQHSTYRGYRRDCSGFVSMAWKLKKSYTSSTIRQKARKISWRKLKPGDAVRRSGHVAIFGGWKNKRMRTYWALEESTWGKPAQRRVKTFKRGYSALRYRGIQERSAPRRTTPPAPPHIIVPVTPPSVGVTISITPSADTTASVTTSTVDAQYLALFTP